MYNIVCATVTTGILIHCSRNSVSNRLSLNTQHVFKKWNINKTNNLQIYYLCTSKKWQFLDHTSCRCRHCTVSARGYKYCRKVLFPIYFHLMCSIIMPKFLFLTDFLWYFYCVITWTIDWSRVQIFVSIILTSYSDFKRFIINYISQFTNALNIERIHRIGLQNGRFGPAFFTKTLKMKLIKTKLFIIFEHMNFFQVDVLFIRFRIIYILDVASKARMSITQNKSYHHMTRN